MNSKEIILKKTNDEILTYNEIKFMVDGYVKGKISDKVMSQFIMLIYDKGFTIDETYYLTDVMLKSGDIISLDKVINPCVDKHSTGGVGDKVTLIVAAICASAGVCVPKMSGRGLGLTGGTIDKLESIPGFNIKLSKKEFISTLNKIGCSVIGQSEDIAVADKKIYALRNEIGAVDSIPLIASSIMSKKIACGCDNIVIDLKVGKGAFMKNVKSATQLAKTMIKIGEKYNKKVVCVLSDMDTPLGLNIGNALEIKEAIDFFNHKYEKRLYELCIHLSSVMISVAKNIELKKAKTLVKRLVDSDFAKYKFYQWIKYQGGDVTKINYKSKELKVLSNKDGYVNKIDAHILSKICFDLGAGRKTKKSKVDYTVGIVINKPLGSKVRKGDVIGTIHYNKEIDNMEKDFLSAFKIDKKKNRPKKIIIKTIK